MDGGAHGQNGEGKGSRGPEGNIRASLAAGEAAAGDFLPPCGQDAEGWRYPPRAARVSRSPSQSLVEGRSEFTGPSKPNYAPATWFPSKIGILLGPPGRAQGDADRRPRDSSDDWLQKNKNARTSHGRTTRRPGPKVGRHHVWLDPEPAPGTRAGGVRAAQVHRSGTRHIPPGPPRQFGREARTPRRGHVTLLRAAGGTGEGEGSKGGGPAVPSR
jgi:hypothetical protein